MYVHGRGLRERQWVGERRTKAGKEDDALAAENNEADGEQGEKG